MNTYTDNNRTTEPAGSESFIQGALTLVVLITSIILLMTADGKAQVNIPKNVNIGFMYPISTNGRHAPLDTNCLSVNLLASVSSVEKGPSIAGFSNVVKHEAYGPQIAGFSNHIGGRAGGSLFAGFANTYGGGSGGAFAGFTNVSKGNVSGAQFAGFTNVSGDLTGAQFAGFTNVAKDLSGAQFAGFLNRAEDVKGSQAAGFMNLASKDISASQTAGFMNKARNVNGSQIAGFINIARKVKGAQIAGFINVADSSDYPIGFVNIVKNGEKSIGVTMNGDQTAMLSFRSGGKVLYGIIGAGYNFINKNEQWAGELGFGAHIIRSKVFNLNMELTESILESFRAGEYFKSTFALMPAFRLTPHLEIFGGPTFNYITTNTTEGQTLHDHYLRTWDKPGRNFQAVYLSYTGGIAIPF